MAPYSTLGLQPFSFWSLGLAHAIKNIRVKLEVIPKSFSKHKQREISAIPQTHTFLAAQQAGSSFQGTRFEASWGQVNTGCIVKGMHLSQKREGAWQTSQENVVSQLVHRWVSLMAAHRGKMESYSHYFLNNSKVLTQQQIREKMGVIW